MGWFGKKKKEERIFGEDGYDQDGWDRNGYDRQGYNIVENDRHGNKKPDNYQDRIIAKSITLEIPEPISYWDDRAFDQGLEHLQHSVIQKEQNTLNVLFTSEDDDNNKDDNEEDVTSFSLIILKRIPKNKDLLINSSTIISYDRNEQKYFARESLRMEIEEIENKGYQLMKEKKYELAISQYEHALSKDSSNENILLNKGFCLVKLGKVEQALECYNKILLNNPINITAIQNKIELLETFGDKYQHELKELYKQQGFRDHGTWEEIHNNEGETDFDKTERELKEKE
jgi:tetratricopeptide (TPR) repeat protein